MQQTATSRWRAATRARFSPLGLVLALCLPAAAQVADLPEYPIDFGQLRGAFPAASVIVVGARACHHVDALLADTIDRRARGLMFVRSMPARSGMVFVNPRPRTLSMWMKNTLISLDMIFIGADQRVVSIAAETTPLSLDSLRSDGASQYVLELNAGVAADWGITPGGQILIFDAARSATD